MSISDDEFLERMMTASIDDYVEWERRGYCLTCERPTKTCLCINPPEESDHDPASSD